MGKGWQLRYLTAGVSVIVVAVIAAALPGSALARTTACPGSLSGNGTYRADDKGTIRDYNVRNGSCPAARKLLRVLVKDDDAFATFGRGGTAIARVVVPGGSAWKCRLGFIVNGKRRSLFDLENIDVKKIKSFVESGSCRPLTGRLNRRVTLRTRNIRDQLVNEEG